MNFKRFAYHFIRFYPVRVLAGFAIVGFILFTSPGLNLTLKIINFASAYKISFQTAKGALLSHWDLYNLTVHVNENEIHIKHLALDWAPRALGKKKIQIKSLGLHDVKFIEGKTTEYIEKRKSARTKQFTIFGLSVEVDELALNKARFIKASHKDYKLNRVQFSAQASPTQVTLNDLFFDSGPLKILGTAKLSRTQTLEAQISSVWQYETPDSSTSRGKALIQIGDSPSAPFVLQIKSTIPEQASHPNFQIQVQSDGTVSDHTITGNIKSAALKMNLKISGALDHDTWHGTLQDSLIETPELGKLTLATPTKMQVSKKAASLGNICWTDANKIHKFCANANLYQKKFDAPQISANLLLQTSKLQFLSTLIPAAQFNHGTLDGSINVSGKVFQPEVSGKLILSMKDLFLPNWGTHITPFHTEMTLTHPRTIKILAGGNAGKGQFKLTGTSENYFSQLNLKLNGKHLQISNTPEYTIFADPDLTVNIKNRQIAISGKIHIPSALLAPRDLTRSITPSEDVVFVDTPKATQVKRPLRYQTDLTLSLGDKVHYKGKNLQSYFKGSLKLQAAPQKPVRAQGKLSMHHGSYNILGHALTIKEGHLIFTNGPINNPAIILTAERKVAVPSDDDSIKSGVLTVGAKVTGTFHQPQLSLYAQPTLNESDTLAYLLIGKRRSNASEAEGQFLFEAASQALSMFQQDSGATSLSKRLGLDDISFETLSDTDDTSLENVAIGLSKQLSDKLFLHYSFGLLEAINRLHLQYMLNKHITLDVNKTHEGSGADIIYRIEK